MKAKNTRRLTYEEQIAKLKEFITSFEDCDSQQIDQRYGRKKYLTALQAIADEDQQILEIQIEDLQSFFRKEEEQQMVQGFRRNTARYIDLFTQVAEQLIPQRAKEINPDDEFRYSFQNILKEQRRENLLMQSSSLIDSNEKIPFSAHKNFDVAIVYGVNGKVKPRAISDLKSEDIGCLIVLKAIVVRASEIKPQIAVATFACYICGCENYMEVIDNNYRPLDKCTSKKCIENKVNGKLAFLPNHSKFRAHQELRIQEIPDQLRDGRIPRTYTLHLNDSNVKQASPGDIILVQGILEPQRKLGFRHQSDLSFECFIQAVKIKREKKKYIQMTLTQDQIAEIEGVRASYDQETLFNRMAASIAPEIYGMEKVKQALLLLMAGGVTKETHDNLKIRGEINIALIGDPGIAKSQILKHISYLAPRAVYTTGKGSSGVGLTAAVVADPLSKELSLQAGALVLADMGICCIDQFDKMDQFDRTAIHEVMQQQTVSIAKAGITTTLNARTSILAAANPLYGRYNRNETIHKNINLPAALLSRFDLIFILLDEPDKQKDLQLAKHIGAVHKNRKAMGDSKFFSPLFIRSYVAQSKSFNPVISGQLHNILINKYIQKRHQQVGLLKEGEKYITTRSLLALIRLCQAKARIRFSNEVSLCDITECLDLMEEAQKSITSEHTDRKPMQDYATKIYEIIKEICKYSNGLSVGQELVKKRVLARGYNEGQMLDTLQKYIDLNLIMKDEETITLLE